jgi:hypothetical protein
MKLSKVLLTGGPSIAAHGPSPVTPFAPGRDAAERYRSMREDAGGWFLFASFEPLSAWTSNVRALLKAPTFVPTKNPALAAGAGLSSNRRVGEDFREVPVRPADGLPKGALHLVHSVVPNPAYVPRPSSPALEGAYEHHIFIAGTETSTWFAVAETEGLARARLLSAMSGKSGGLEDRPELAGLRSLPAGGIGFATLKGVLALMAHKETTEEIVRYQKAMQAVGALGGGATPVFFSLAPSSAGDGSAGMLRITAEVSKAGARELLPWLGLR